MLTVNQVVEKSTEQSFLMHFDQFLDDFLRASNEDRELAVSHEPEETGRIAKYKICMLAAAVERLSKEHGIRVPDWVKKERYRMGRPYYEFGTTNRTYQALLREVSPEEFRKRNLFVYPNVIDRV